jgi:hypothetical protein
LAAFVGRWGACGSGRPSFASVRRQMTCLRVGEGIVWPRSLADEVPAALARALLVRAGTDLLLRAEDELGSAVG